MGTKVKSVQLGISDHSSSSANKKLRYFKPGLGSIMSREADGMMLIKRRVEILQKCAKTEGSQTGNNDVHDATSNFHLHSFTVRQQSSIVLSIENAVGWRKVRIWFQPARKSGITSCLAKFSSQQSTSQGWLIWEWIGNLEIWRIQVNGNCA